MLITGKWQIGDSLVESLPTARLLLLVNYRMNRPDRVRVRLELKPETFLG